jgi:peptidoglycan hydrolase-like protein with peptidoglycan-binding domain
VVVSKVGSSARVVTLAVGAVLVVTIAACSSGGATTTAAPAAAPVAGESAGAPVKVADGISRDPSGRPFLFGGEHSDDVKDLERWLNLAGYELDEDGFFGPAVVAVVKQFQSAQGMTPDGVVGSETWAAVAHPKPPTTTTTAASTTSSSTTAPPVTAPPTTLAPDPLVATGPLAAVVVHLSTQQLELLDPAGNVTHRLPVSSGANGATPPGTFTVFRKVPRAVSDSDADVSMPWLVNFNGGIGFHGIPVKGTVPLPTPLGLRPVSHGCVRMADAAAKFLYDNLPIGATVTVVA